MWCLLDKTTALQGKLRMQFQNLEFIATLLQTTKMAAVGVDMEEKEEKKKEELVEHSLEGDFQFIPTALTMSKSAQVMWNFCWFISVSNVVVT